MTFSIIGRDPGTGAFGVAVTSSSPCVAARCAHVRPGVGAAASQNVTNPALGQRMLAMLAEGVDAEHAVSAAVASDPASRYRQVTAIGADGPAAVFSGEGTLGTYRAAVGTDVVAAGNLLSSPSVVDAMVEAFESGAGPLEERLLAGMLAGRDAGGEEGPEHSAGLVVVEGVPWPVTDLRVDWADDDPIGALAGLWKSWSGEKQDYLTRALDPSGAPTYGVPGDL